MNEPDYWTTANLANGEEKLLTLESLASYDSQIKLQDAQKVVKKKYSRTPSGNILTNQVQSVKVFFSPTEKEKYKRKKLEEVKERHLHLALNDHGNLPLMDASNVNDSLCGQPLNVNKDCEPTTPNYHDQSQINQSDLSSTKKRKLSQNQSEEQDQASSKDCNPKTPDQLDKMEISPTREQRNQGHQTEEEMLTTFLKEHGISNSSNVVDIKTVLHMFKSLSVKLDESADARIDLMTKKMQETVEKDVNKNLEIYENRIKTLEAELRNTNRRAKLTEDILVRNNDILSDMMKRLDSIELANARRAAILTGMELDPANKKQDKIKILTDFFYKDMEVYTRIEDVYNLGTAMVISFQTLEDKEVVFAKKSMLKDIGSNLGKKIFLNHYLPATENEKRKRERKIAKDLKLSDEKNKPEVSYGKGGMKVGASVYSKKIQTPEPTDLLKLTTSELDEVMETRVLKGPQIHDKDSIFISYGVDATGFEYIRKAYLKLKLVHAAARHIICAYHLPGPDSQMHLNSDFCDDQENGSGARLLQEMTANNIFNKAIFVVRYCGKDKLADSRHSSYIEAARQLLDQKPYNEVLQKKQHIAKEEVKKQQVKYKYKQQDEEQEKQVQKERRDPHRGRRGRST